MKAGNVIGVAGSLGSSRGVPLSNTPPATLQVAGRTGGEDWFEVMVYLDWKSVAGFSAIRDELDAAQLAARDPRTPKDGFVTLPGSRGLWRVHAHGCKLGGGQKGPSMRWRLERDGIEFGLASRLHPHETNPSGFVRMTGELLIASGDARGMWAKVLRWFRELGARVVSAKVSRVDLCADLPGVGVSELVAAFRRGDVIRRTRRGEEWAECVHTSGRKETGLSLGAGTMCRIYDKAEECRDLAKRAWMISRRWGGLDRDEALRVEFQCRREFLKARGIDTVRDYFKARASLAEYLAGRWLRFVSDLDSRHTERAQDLPIWSRVRDAFRSWTGSKCVDLPPVSRRDVRFDDLAAMIRGTLESVAARVREPIASGADLVAFFDRQLRPRFEADALIPVRVELKKNRTLPFDDVADKLEAELVGRG